MNHWVKQALAITLTLCFLFVTVSFGIQATSHLLQHAHHKAKTHASPLCTWVCSGTEIHSGIDIYLPQENLPLHEVELFVSDTPPFIIALDPSPRGPPHSFTL